MNRLVLVVRKAPVWHYSIVPIPYLVTINIIITELQPRIYNQTSLKRNKFCGTQFLHTILLPNCKFIYKRALNHNVSTLELVLLLLFYFTFFLNKNSFIFIKGFCTKITFIILCLLFHFF
jgi:hypothetical protein